MVFIDEAKYQVGLVSYKAGKAIAFIADSFDCEPKKHKLNNVVFYSGIFNHHNFSARRIYFSSIFVSQKGSVLSMPSGTTIFNGYEPIRRVRVPNYLPHEDGSYADQDLEKILFLTMAKHNFEKTENCEFVYNDFENAQIMINSKFRTSDQIQFELILSLMRENHGRIYPINEKPVFVNRNFIGY